MGDLQFLPGINEDKSGSISRIYDYIVAQQGNCYYDVIKKDFRPEVFEALTDRRTAELVWYDFAPGSNVLELGAGWGEATGGLALKCGRVVAVEENLYKAQGICHRHADKDNLAVYAGDWHYLPEKGGYDYVIFHDVESYLAEGEIEPLSDLVRLLCAFLKPEGRLLMNIANRFAMKYWCGASRELWWPVASPANGALGKHGFSKREIEGELSTVEAIRYKFYYPMFDRHKPRQIFTDDYLPTKEALKAMELYRCNKNVVLNDEREMYAAVIEEGIFPLFADSFLVECAREKGQLSSIIYAKISADRPRKLAMATVAFADKVVKAPLFEDGYGHLRDMLAYQADLQANGIPVVDMEYRDNMLVMPIIKQQKLDGHLKNLAKTDREAFIACLDRLYDVICRSSEHVSVEESPFCRQAKDKDWGPILRHAYLELIDLNCFYDGEFLFYDQEYRREAMPARYIMYREILNLYYAHPEIEAYIHRADMLERFGIDKLLDMVEKEEQDNFLAGLFDKELSLRLWEPYGSGVEKQRRARREAYLFAGCGDKVLAVIGCGRKFTSYMSQYGKRYSPDVLVDNNRAKWGEEVQGIVVSNPQKLTEYAPEQLHVVVCIKDYESVEAQLLEMGIYNYRMF